MFIRFRELNACKLWSIGLEESFPAKTMNLCLTPKWAKIPGFGIYSIAYNSPQFGNRIIYLGKFSGVKNKSGVDNALAGDVKERWFKHIGTATLLLKNLKMSSRKHYHDHKNSALEFYKGDSKFYDAFKNSFLNLGEDILKSKVFIKGADLQVSRNRLGFAIQNLKETNKFHPNNAEELKEIISRFTCFYWQVTSPSPIKKSFIDLALTGRKNRKGVESEVIKKYQTKLPMNKEYTAEIAPNRTYYHYNPINLIEVNTPEFREYSDFIKLQIKNFLIHQHK
jgi:hypothetical protein